MLRKLLLISLFFFAFAQTTFAKKAYYSMQMLACMADVIVTGKITSVSGYSYTFALDNIIKGNTKNKITVKMFREWTCDYRWKKPAPGQELLLFLTKSTRDSFDIINGSCGEIFIVADTLHRAWGLVQQTKLADAITGLQNFIACYKMVNKEVFPKNGLVFNQVKSDAEILSLKKLNDFSTWLFDGMKDYIVEKTVQDISKYRPHIQLFFSFISPRYSPSSQNCNCYC